MDESDLEKWCAMLESNKVRTRKEACTEFAEHLQQKSTIDFLNNSVTDWWKAILGSIFRCMDEVKHWSVGIAVGKVVVF